MSKTEDIINSISENSKIKCLNRKEYSDEPLLFTASQMKSYTPTKYSDMRKLVQTKEYYDKSSANIFYIQAKYMEDFTDDYKYKSEFFRYFPTYRDMTILQLRSYFTWRANVRKGIIEETSASFTFVYIYELLNLIGASSALDAFNKINNFVEAYSKYSTKLKYYVDRWTRDLIVYYNLDPDLLNQHPDNKYEQALITLSEYKEHSKEEVLSALNNFSSYNVYQSSFYKKHPDDTCQVIYKVFDNLFNYYSSKKMNDIFDKMFGDRITEKYFMFNSAVFYEKQKHPDCIYQVNKIHKYICKDNNWNRVYFMWKKDKAGKIGVLLKGTDYFLRQKNSYKSTLKLPEISKLFTNNISKAINDYYSELNISKAQKVEIDISKLNNIRETSIETQNKLIVDKEEFEEIVEPEVETNSVLSKTECEFLIEFFKGNDCFSKIKSRGIMLSVLIDTINEKLYDTFGDTVIIYENNTVEVIEDYREELKGLIGFENS